MSTPSKDYHFEFLMTKDLKLRTIKELNFLVRQLTECPEAQITQPKLAAALRSSKQRIVVAYHGSTIVGMGRVCVMPPLTYTECVIHDVVVDENHLRKGVGREILKMLLHEADTRYFAHHVNLTSRSSREGANELYKKAGFELRETNFYRYTFKR